MNFFFKNIVKLKKKSTIKDFLFGTFPSISGSGSGYTFYRPPQNRICRNIHACSKPDLDDHWSYKWLFLSEELWVVLCVDVHVIVGEHSLTFFSFQFQYKKTRIIMPRAYCKKVLCVCF